MSAEGKIASDITLHRSHSGTLSDLVALTKGTACGTSKFLRGNRRERVKVGPGRKEKGGGMTRARTVKGIKAQ